MAVLATNPLLASGRRAVLFPDNLQLDAGVNRDLMTRDTKMAGLKLLELNGRCVNRLPRAFLVRRCFDFPVITMSEYVSQATAVTSGVHGCENVPRFDASLTIDTLVTLTNAVADNACDTFGSRGRGVVQIGFPREAERRADR